ncbi:MAG: hypothetical protein WCT18_03610 [Patescibacteria group bacterium]
MYSDFGGKFATHEKPKTVIKKKELLMIDTQIELAILRHSGKLNEGQNGVILELFLDATDSCYDLIEEIEKQAQKNRKVSAEILSAGTVGKFLKIYKPGSAKREFEMQSKAFEIVNRGETDGLANVPMPILYRDLKVSGETKQKLKDFGVGFVDNNVEVLLMEKIPGMDLATMLYREVIKRHPAGRPFLSTMEEMSFSDLHQLVANFLEFDRPGGQSDTVAGKEYEKIRVENGNAEKIYKFLIDSGFVLDKRILQMIDDTIKEFHKNGLVLRDAHQRNFMISGEGDDLRVSIIDYGSAISFVGDYGAELFLEGEKRYPVDEMVVQTMKKLTKSKERQIADELAQFARDMQSIYKLLERNITELNELKMAMSTKKFALKASFELVMSSSLVRGQSVETKGLATLAIFFDFLKKGEIEKPWLKEKIAKFLSTKTGLPNVVELKLKKFYQVL